MQAPSIYAVIMAGGTGTRFWPASRRALPKQFLPIVGHETMLAATQARVSQAVGIDKTIVVTNAQHVELVRASLPSLPPGNILAEPVGRNTLACVAWATLEIKRREPDAVQLVLPSDHVINDHDAFTRSVLAAAEVARTTGALVTFGVEPDHPATGYGYIQAAPASTSVGGEDVRLVERFVEKPDEARAREFLAAGTFLWNSGIFVWTNDAIEAALREHAPAVFEPLAAAGPDQIAATYAALPSISIDVGVMERAGDVRVLPIDYGWSDVGSWQALEPFADNDEAGNGNCGAGRLVQSDARGNLVYSDGDTITALIGVEDLVVVRTERATLVCPKSRSQEVRAIVAQLESSDPSEL
jgi:mannose-1-phosphate guanylyltransferase